MPYLQGSWETDFPGGQVYTKNQGLYYLREMIRLDIGNNRVFKVELKISGTFMMEFTQISLSFLDLHNGMQMLFSAKIMKLE